MHWEECKINKESKEITIPSTWLHIHYYEALNILFRFENTLRVFVYVILKNELKENWDNVNIRDNDSIRKVASIRISQAKDYGYVCYDIKSPMLYLSTADLIDVIMNDKNWKYFRNFFKAKKEIIKFKLLEISAIRNSLAHFRPIQHADLEVIKLNLKHIMSEIDQTLVRLISVNDNIPTNTECEWYIELKGIESKNVNIHLNKDKKFEWIKIKLFVKSKIFKKGFATDNYVSYTASKISSLNILDKYIILKNNITYAKEAYTGQKNQNDEDAQINKSVEFVISKKNLENKSKEIIDDIKSIVSKIDEEIELLSLDHLAQGELISSCNVTFNNDKDYWKFNYENLKDNIDNYSESEFWGDYNMLFIFDYTTDVSTYPWMMTEISKNKYGF
ncbi:hypothetical protein L5F64_02130 [Aliarcobacter butzleri]|nr:hypothetical protein [Aliarcobacter butzleri]